MVAGISPDDQILFEDIAGEIARNRDALDAYAHILAAGNRSARLTGPSDPDVIWEEHILDCAFSLPCAPETGLAVDVGSGGGLPGIVWAICRPRLTVVLLESVRKKCAALSEMARELGLENIVVECERSEILASSRRENFTSAVSRAVGHLGVAAEYMSPLVTPGGRLVCFKGPRLHEELAEIGPRWDRLGLDFPSIRPYNHKDKKLYLVLWNKSAHCPDRFPRRPGRAQKQHWWR
ncbi:MAG: rRNA (guanine527-N7)-methyltransferase [Synergistales bacterium]|nr:rRNA (guanine527-N7)-methyltransferase [Synergistales bacterium]